MAFASAESEESGIVPHKRNACYPVNMIDGRICLY